MLGRIVGNYRIVEKIGEGGMGAVYRAVDEMLDREVALKAIRPELAREPQIVERFRAEAKILARVSHPAIATIYSFFPDGGELFLAMEYVRGRTLREVLEAGALPWQQAVPLLSTALEGIEQAHRAGIVHRDLKPDNLMLTEAGSLKVMDFGIARMAGSSHMTRTGLLLGTLRYVAPEQIRGEEVDQRTDIYALGIVLYQLLTGRVPFDGPTDFAILKAQLDDPPVPPGSLVPGLPEWLDRAVLKALEKDPAARFQTVDELRAFLQHPEVRPEVQPEPAAAFPTRVLPPRPTAAGATAASPETMETDRARLPDGPPPLPTTATSRPPVPGTSYRPVESAGWKRGAVAALLAVAGLAAGLVLWSRRGPETAAPPSPQVSIADTPAQATEADPAAPEPAPAANQEAAGPVVPATVTAQPPRPTPAPRRQEMPKPAGPPVPTPPVSEETPATAPDEPEQASPPQENPPAALEPAPDPGEPPIEELRRLGGELVAGSERLIEVYEVFLEQKEDGGAEITESDEQLQEELETLLGTAERFNNRFKDGFFARTKDRLRKRDQKAEIVKRARELAAATGRVERLMATVRPGPDVRQSWQEVRDRWERVAQLTELR